MVDKQSDFLKTVAIWVLKATEMGYQLTCAEFGRTPEMAKIYANAGKGIANSLHITRLAADVNAFFDGKYLNGEEKWHIHHLEKLGILWESMDTRARWGGRFTKKDYNHYSFEHNGVK